MVCGGEDAVLVGVEDDDAGVDLAAVIDWVPLVIDDVGEDSEDKVSIDMDDDSGVDMVVDER